MVDRVAEGVATLLKSSIVGERQATVLMFSCLINYPDKNEIQTHFRNGFVVFYQLLQDPELIVVKNTLNGFVTLAEIFPQVFLTNPEIEKIFHHLLGMTKSEDENVKILSLNILGNITEVLGQYPDPIAYNPEDYMKVLVETFTDNLNRQT